MNPMIEQRLKRAFVDRARQRFPAAVIFRHEDIRTAGVPDLSFTWRGLTTWIEFKVGPRPKLVGVQALTCARLAREGRCWIVVWDDGGTYVYRPRILNAEVVVDPMASSTKPRDHDLVLDMLEVERRQP